VAICRHDLHIVHTVERAQGREGFSYFHYLFTALSVVGCRKLLYCAFAD
jgi:hypothetical protein